MTTRDDLAPAAGSGTGRGGSEAIRERFDDVRRRVGEACERAGRRAADVRVVGVTKTHPRAVVSAALDAGLEDVGENRVGEMLDKMRTLPTGRIRWHFVGRLQSNKAKDVVGRAVLVHSLDRRSLADELSKRARRAEVVQRVLVQVNVGEDPAKGGCSPDAAHDLVAYARDLPNLSVEGLMTIPPLPPDHARDGGEAQAQAARPHFAALRELRDRLRGEWPEVTHLSMGMSADFEVAVEEGATIVRLGTVLFGPRNEGG